MSTIRSLDLVDLELPQGGRLRLTLEDVPPDGMKALDELFDVLANVAKLGTRQKQIWKLPSLGLSTG